MPPIKPLKPIRIPDLIRYWVGYFGEDATQELTDTLAGFLADECEEAKRFGIHKAELYLGALNRIVIDTHPRQYKRMPGVAELRSFIQAATKLYHLNAVDDAQLRIEEKPISDDDREKVAEAIRKINTMGFHVGGAL